MPHGDPSANGIAKNWTRVLTAFAGDDFAGATGQADGKIGGRLAARFERCNQRLDPLQFELKVGVGLEAVGDSLVLLGFQCSEDKSEQIVASGSVHFNLLGWSSPKCRSSDGWRRAVGF